MKGFTAVLFFATLALCSAGPLENNVPGEDAAVGIGSFVNADGNIQTVGYTVDKQKEKADVIKEGLSRVVRSAPASAVVEEAAVGIGSFVNADGNIQTVGYTVDKEKEQADVIKEAPLVKGLPRVVRSAPAPAVVQLPLPVQYTPEVAAARAEHLRVLSQSYLRSGGYFPITYVQPPAPYIIPGARYHPDYLPYAGL